MEIRECLPQDCEFYQTIDKDGNLVGEDPGLDEALLKDMFWWMLYGRLADDKAIKLQRQGRLGTYAPSTGQEAAQVGSALAMDRDDWLFPAFRELSSYMIRDLPFENILLYFMGDPRGNIPPAGIKSFPIFVPVSTQVPIAAGFAWAKKLQKEGCAVLCYLGDGGTSEGDFHEGMNFAGVFGAPVVFLVQNNQWAISVSRKRQTASRTIAQKGEAYGFPGIYVDGNDVMAVYIATKRALDAAKKGEGPSLIEAFTYRRLMHTTADDPKRYRTDEEQKDWEDKDPLKRFRLYLKNKGVWTQAWEDDLTLKAQDLIKTSVEKAESIGNLRPEEMFEHIYSEMTPDLKDQLGYLKKALEGKEIEEDAVELKGGFP
ncbi:MAG: pyruvate dehydrogenase (acetyl-transferring) E1 component subunit alpha [Candidatus Thermoplasmatota archaeon]|jgi:pyruvate dehydrogenase E1 component alpha subunit|nr:pyruvate dehydrogenase (acetyl-transferring) E1 component subunit alpha [Candidatus Thermoplasmatota archaeon]